MLVVLGTTEAPTRTQNQQGEPVIYRARSQACRNAASPQPIRPSGLLVGRDHFGAYGVVIPPFQ